ncbi:insulin receptor substrate 1 [Culicoides brevitarsis]|uniref:insulin receptor substrate 1 n=1 Tax=Culicoides brevitarsis TaxID=469753 RepID=UPI00307BE182
MTDKNVVLEGYMKKLKTTKKKYFVLFGDTRDMFAHLRYYDSEKKFKQSLNKRDTPNSKKCIILRECFNINRRLDTRHPNVLALYTKEECFSIIFEFEEDLHKWLNALLRLQKGSSLNDSEPTPRPQFDHIWEVNIEKKGLGESKGLHGPYRLCICEKNLSFVKAGIHLTPNRDTNLDIIDISLGSIRRYGAQQCYFYLEIGRVSKTGPGELYLATADPLTAQNLYDTILRYVKQGKVIEESTAVYHRDRSLSVNETSKPVTQYNIGSMELNSEIKPYNDSCHRERCDSLPSSNVISLNKTKSATRPYSVCSRSPTTPSPLSPMSHTLSSKSDDDSSFTVDEVDCIDDVSKNFKNLSCSHSKMTILEETSEDMSISEKGQTHLHENTPVTISESLVEKQEYLEMLPSLESKTRTEVRSRTSSFAEDIPSYNTRFHLPDGLSSSASSVTSGTPSTDTRFSAFHLEKTFSHFSEDNNDFVLRPTRTYSVGSKPDNIKTKTLDGFNTDAHKNSTRIRAFSVGSKVKNRLNDLGKIDTKEKKMRKPQSDKCTSVPALIKTPKSGISDQADHISFQNKSGSLNRSIFGSPKTTDSSEYMVMHPSNNNAEKFVQETKKSDYVEMGARSDRFSSKPIEIVIKKNNDKFQSHDTTSSPQIDYASEIDSHNTMFPLSLDKNSTWDMKSLPLESKLTTSNSQEHQHNDVVIDSTQHIDEGDYATLLPGDGFENKKDEDMKDYKPNYIDLYFPQQSKENNCNPKKDDTTTKSTYAQIVFPDFQPK